MPVAFDFEHDVQTVYETLTDPQFLVDRCLALGELSAACDIEERGKRVILTLEREIERDLPRALAKVFSPVQKMHMTEEWEPCKGGWRGQWEMQVQGQPVTISARFELTATRNGSRYSVSHSAKAKVPLLGRAIEKYILSQTSDGASDELSYLRDYLEAS